MLKSIIKDERAPEEIIDLYKPYVYAVIGLTLGYACSVYDIEPLVFDVFFSLWRYRSRIAEGRVISFLCVAARNRANSFLRRRGREIPTDPDELPERTVLREGEIQEIVERRLGIEERLSILDRRTRELFFRRYALGETVEEAAKALHMKNSTAKSRLMRGRTRMEKDAGGNTPVIGRSPGHGQGDG